jgi:hypothetical protein
MNREDIIRMAREADEHANQVTAEDAFIDWYEVRDERFAALVAAAEREACARVCEPQSAHDDPLTAWKIAAAIRARGEVPR